MDIRSFDKTELHLCRVIRPEKYSELKKLAGHKLIARGAGLSYCNAAVSTDALVVDMTRMNRILEFDLAANTITVESGITIGDLNSFLYSRGFMLEVLPGYPSITVGGCVAFNVHGKSQSSTGTFSSLVCELCLLKPDGSEVTISRKVNADLFELTLGGFGLTGIIISTKLTFSKLKGGRFRIERKFVKNISEAVKVMMEDEPAFDYVYSWNNLNLRGDDFGQGVVYLESFEEGKSVVVNYSNRLSLSSKLPSLHNELSVHLMCHVYYFLEKLRGRMSIKDFYAASFPIYNKEVYFYLFGKRGFMEYQMLFPFENWRIALEEIRIIVEKMKVPVALGSLKIFHGEKHNLSFTGSGVCLAIDVMNNAKSLELFRALDEVVIKNAGTVNLSKDSRVSAETVKAIFPAYSEFRKAIQANDPSSNFTSPLKSRIGLS